METCDKEKDKKLYSFLKYVINAIDDDMCLDALAMSVKLFFLK